jgi:carbamoyl-phosphate synthase small subunit
MTKIATGAIALEDGTIFWGHGHGAKGVAAGELCFNTAMTGYQEILTDPSYAEQIVLFTFPHIGNVGANADDQEESSAQGKAPARGAVFKAPPTLPSSWRAADQLGDWLKTRNIIGLSGIDTRALTRRIRELGMPKAAIATRRTASWTRRRWLKRRAAGRAWRTPTSRSTSPPASALTRPTVCGRWTPASST